MRIWTGLVAIIAAAGAIYGWGIGFFYPCGPVDRIVRTSDCRIVTTFDASQLQALLKLPNGNLLTVARQDGPDPTELQRLLELDPETGAILSETAITGLPPGASWMNAAVSPAGAQLAATMLDQQTAVIDRASGQVTTQFPPYSVGLVGFDGEDRVLIDRGEISSEHPPDIAAQVFSARDGSALGQLTDGAAKLIYTGGVSQAFSPDGTLLAQHVETRGDSGVVALRLADAAFQSWSGQLLTAPLGAWRMQLLPWIWFSPDGRYVAASFDGASVWGKDTSALLIWDVQSLDLIQRLPTRSGEIENLVWLDNDRVAMTRFDLGSRRGEILTLPVGRR